MPKLEEVIPCRSYCSLQKLVRVTAHVLRFLSNLKRSFDSKKIAQEDITQEEYGYSQELWVKEVQKSFQESEKFGQLKVSLFLFSDDKDVLRCGGRLKNASIPYDTRFPIILPRDSFFTELVIWNCRQRVMHNGVRDTLTELTSKFWVLKGHRTVQNVISKCSTCKKVDGRCFKVPPSPHLPEFRLSDEFVFTQVGVDFAGPIFVKNKFWKNPGMYKSYIALFTCASS